MTKLSKTTPIVRELLAKSFPRYAGRTLSLQVSEAVYLDPYGGGGTWSDYVLVDMTTGAAAPYTIPAGGPFRDGNAFRSVPLPANAVLVEHVRFCGKDLGIRFHVNPSATHALARAAAIPSASRAAIAP